MFKQSKKITGKFFIKEQLLFVSSEDLTAAHYAHHTEYNLTYFQFNSNLLFNL